LGSQTGIPQPAWGLAWREKVVLKENVFPDEMECSEKKSYLCAQMEISSALIWLSL